MEIYSTEQEQIALLKRWLKTYTPPIILGIVIAVAIGFSWHHWQNAKMQTSEAASVVYVNMVGATLEHLDSEATLMANSLINKYSSTPYAQFGALLLAKQAAENGAYDEASTRLNWVIDKTKIPAIKQIAKIRLAKVDIAAQHPQAALDLLENIDDPVYLGMIKDTQGDAYMALKQTAQAKAAYEAAVKVLPPSATTLIQLKLANIV